MYQNIIINNNHNWIYRVRNWQRIQGAIIQEGKMEDDKRKRDKPATIWGKRAFLKDRTLFDFLMGMGTGYSLTGGGGGGGGWKRPCHQPVYVPCGQQGFHHRRIKGLNMNSS